MSENPPRPRARAQKRKERLGLRDTLSRDMVVSSWAVSARTLLLVRSAILVFCTISLLVMIDPVHNGVGAIGGAFFWFTNWGFILLTVYFGQAVAYTLRGPPPESSAAQPQTAWQTAIWLNFEIAGMSAIFIDVVLWGILWPSSGFDAIFFHPMMLIVHGANFFIVAIEMALNRIPVNKSHYFAVVGYTAIYGLFATFEHLVLYDGRRWPYAAPLLAPLFPDLLCAVLDENISLGSLKMPRFAVPCEPRFSEFRWHGRRYFFMDVEHLGWSVMLWYCVLLLIQAAFWYLLVRIDGIKVRRHSSKPSSDLHILAFVSPDRLASMVGNLRGMMRWRRMVRG